MSSPFHRGPGSCNWSLTGRTKFSVVVASKVPSKPLLRDRPLSATGQVCPNDGPGGLILQVLPPST